MEIIVDEYLSYGIIITICIVFFYYTIKKLFKGPNIPFKTQN